MSKKRTNDRLPPFVAMLWALLNHKAYIALPPTSKAMLPYFLGKVKLPGNYNDPAYYKTTFEFSYSEGVRLGCAKRTFHEVIKNLMRFGFLDPVVKGGLRGMRQSPSIFKLSPRWKDYGTGNFQEIHWEQFGEHQIRKGILSGGSDL
jgi:hypothetical protein